MPSTDPKEREEKIVAEKSIEGTHFVDDDYLPICELRQPK